MQQGKEKQEVEAHITGMCTLHGDYCPAEGNALAVAYVPPRLPRMRTIDVLMVVGSTGSVPFN